MSQLDALAARLRQGAPVTFHARGQSMEPLITDGALVTVVPLGDHKVTAGDIVLVTVHGSTYLHKVLSVVGNRVQIGSNKGGVNGWTHIAKVWGLLEP